MSEQMEKPTDISFTSDDIKKHSSRPSLKNGWYQWLTTEATTAVAKSGHLMVVMRCAPLAELDDPSSKVQKFAVRNNLILPFDNPNVEGHKAPNTAGLCHAALMAIFGQDEVPDYPRVIDGVLSFKGNEIEKAEEKESREEVTEIVFNKCQELWADPSPLVDQAFYARKVQNGDYSNIEKLSAELPAGESLLARAEWEAVAEEADASEEKPAKTNVNANKNGKAVKKGKK